MARRVGRVTPRMREVLARVVRSHRGGRWFRAEHRGQRVTLAYLYKHGAIVRRAWRGVEGDPDAAHEYACGDVMRDALGMLSPSELAPGMSPTEGNPE